MSWGVKELELRDQLVLGVLVLIVLLGDHSRVLDQGRSFDLEFFRCVHLEDLLVIYASVS